MPGLIEPGHRSRRGNGAHRQSIRTGMVCSRIPHSIHSHERQQAVRGAGAALLVVHGSERLKPDGFSGIADPAEIVGLLGVEEVAIIPRTQRCCQIRADQQRRPGCPCHPMGIDVAFGVHIHF